MTTLFHQAIDAVKVVTDEQDDDVIALSCYDPFKDESQIQEGTETELINTALVVVNLPNGLRLVPDPGLRIKIEGTDLMAVKEWNIIEALRSKCPCEFSHSDFTRNAVTGVVTLMVRPNISVDDRADAPNEAAVIIAESLRDQPVKFPGLACNVFIRVDPLDVDEYPNSLIAEQFSKPFNDCKPGNRADTLILSNLPSKWFAEPGKVIPSKVVLSNLFSSFGQVRQVDILETDAQEPLQLNSTAFVQFATEAGLKAAFQGCCGKLLARTVRDRVFTCPFSASVDFSGHLADVNIRKRRFDRQQAEIMKQQQAARAKQIKLRRDREEQERQQREHEEEQKRDAARREKLKAREEKRRRKEEKRAKREEEEARREQEEREREEEQAQIKAKELEEERVRLLEEYRQHQLALEQQRVAMEMKEQQQQRIQEERRVRAEAALRRRNEMEETAKQKALEAATQKQKAEAEEEKQRQALLLRIFEMKNRKIEIAREVALKQLEERRKEMETSSGDDHATNEHLDFSKALLFSWVDLGIDEQPTSMVVDDKKPVDETTGDVHHEKKPSAKFTPITWN